MKYAVYQHRDEDGNILYVGMTAHLSNRNSHHKGASAWWGKVKNITVEWFDDIDAADAAERDAIKMHSPPFNKNTPRPAVKKHQSETGYNGKFSLTGQQAELLAFIRSYMDGSGGVAPSYGEMLVATNGKSKSNIHRLVNGLIERGHVVKLKGQARSIVLLEAEK